MESSEQTQALLARSDLAPDVRGEAAFMLAEIVRLFWELEVCWALCLLLCVCCVSLAQLLPLAFAPNRSKQLEWGEADVVRDEARALELYRASVSDESDFRCIFSLCSPNHPNDVCCRRLLRTGRRRLARRARSSRHALRCWTWWFARFLEFATLFFFLCCCSSSKTRQQWTTQEHCCTTSWLREATLWLHTWRWDIDIVLVVVLFNKYAWVFYLNFFLI